MALQSEITREYAPHAPLSRWPARLAQAVASLWLRLVAGQTRRATRIVLASLSDRQLRDIGLERHQIETVVRAIDWKEQRFGT